LDATRHTSTFPIVNRKKRWLDLGLTLATLPLWLPLYVLIALAIRRDSPGPAIFKQQRYGHSGRVYEILKFRTMVEDAQESLEDHLLANQQHFWEWAETAKLRNDPRRTRVGRWLRRTSLDELPQLINVLKGEMSLVGPRPIPLAERERYGQAFTTYCKVQPGMTGLWQISGRNDLPYEKRIALDQRYVRTRSIPSDLRILWRTPGAVLSRRGAY
jgi:lipopolysaccharide/colanic/teichoic acid biosynthesis glycosyltransferase